MGDAVWDERAQGGIAIDSLLKCHVLRVLFIAVLGEEDVVRLRYEITPAVNAFQEESDEGGRALELWTERNNWWLSGIDDIGTEYVDLGGTLKSIPDKNRSDGERDLRPAPPSRAKWLNITFHGVTSSGTVQPRFTLQVDLPVTNLTLGDWVVRAIRHRWEGGGKWVDPANE